MKNIVRVIEEVSPEEGYTHEEIERGIWNSPPAKKGQGRYLIMEKTIEKKDFSQIKARYWSADNLSASAMRGGIKESLNYLDFVIEKLEKSKSIAKSKMLAEAREQAQKAKEILKRLIF